MTIVDADIDRMHVAREGTRVRVEIETTGRRDLADLFAKSGILEAGELAHTPFLAFVASPGDPPRVRVELVASADVLVDRYAASTPVMVQWPGRWRSDYFRMTVADVARALELRR